VRLLGCIPSKTLVRPPEVRFEAKRTAGTAAPEQSWTEVAEYRDYMIRHLDDGNQVPGYERDGVSVYKSEARFTGPSRVEVDGARLESQRIIVATGSDPALPDIPRDRS
jgi:pyruvate/2-oxoglutarate dehydrogenase complex dihydrolipoamide dehydrogenase (E3) component